MNAQSRPAGLTEQAAALYRQVLRSTPTGLPEHADELDWPLREAQRVFRDLERMRLARQAPDGVVRVDDPRASVGRLLDQEEAELDERRRSLLELRRSLESFELDYRRGLQLSGPRQPPWEVVAPAQVAPVVEQLRRTSQGPVLQVVAEVDVGPGHDATVRRHWEGVAPSGRALRTIFPLSVLTDAHWHAFAGRREKHGEQQRFLPDDAVRVEFAVFGRTAVLLDEGGGADSDFLVLRAPAILDVFTTLFDELWRRAEPVLPEDASAQDVRLLELLSLGFKDEAIARQLGVGLRTVRRRIAGLMEEHGADTRFQLGRAVTRRGLVD